MPVFPKRRFQHGALPADALRRACRIARPSTASSSCRCISEPSAAADLPLSTRTPARNETRGFSRAARAKFARSLRPYAFFVEEERSASGEVVPVATVFLTNRECPWRCLMCDLWKNTLSRDCAQRSHPGTD